MRKQLVRLAAVSAQRMKIKLLAVVCALAILFDKETFAVKLKEIVEYHNFQLVNYYKADAVDYQKVLDDVLAIADILTAMVVDVSDSAVQSAPAWRFRHV
nr:adenylosuccinate synthetase [Pectobacterium colocasium]